MNNIVRTDSINHFGTFETVLKNWNLDFQTFNGLKVGIARKGPRMVELCGLRNWLTEEPDKELVVSEHALPFLLPYLQAPVAIADDAIYFGSTFERIYGLVLTGIALFSRSVKREEVCGMPAVFSGDAKRLLPVLNRSAMNIEIRKNEIPYYINTLVSEFRKLGKPYDVEFPLVYFETHQKISKIFLKEKIDTFWIALKKRNAEIPAPYLLEYQESGTTSSCFNYTLLLNKLSPRDFDLVSPEFRKLRFFVKGSRLCVASFAPHIFTSSMLEDNSPLFKGTPLAGIWSAISQAAPKPDARNLLYRDTYKNYLIYPVDDLQKAENCWNKQVAEYQSHRHSSLVVLANYLISFVLLLDVAEEMTEVFGYELTPANPLIDEADLAYIAGADLARQIREILYALFAKRQKINLPVVGMELLSDYEIFPQECKDTLAYHNRMDFPKSRTVSELLSCNFSNQHRFVELATRKEKCDVYERLRFGDSYTSLTMKVSAYHNSPNMLLLLHKAMDKRIDSGSIVPKYVRFEGYDDAPYVRLFRAGENEDAYKDQLHRILYLMLAALADSYKSNNLPDKMIQACFNLIAGNLVDEEAFRNLGGFLFVTEYVDGAYNTAFLNETGNKRDLLQYCQDYGLLLKDSDKNESTFTINDYTQYLGEGCTLDASTVNLLRSYVRIACFICKYVGNDGLRELYNWLVTNHNYEAMGAGLEAWRVSLFLPTLDNKESEKVKFSDMPDLPFLKEINSLMLPFPSISEMKRTISTLREMLEGETISSLTTMLPRLLAYVEKRMEDAGSDPLYMAIDRKIDIYYGLAYLAFEKLLLKEYIFISDQIDELVSLLPYPSGDDQFGSSLEWLIQMKEPDVFEQTSAGETKDKIRYFLSLLN